MKTNKGNRAMRKFKIAIKKKIRLRDFTLIKDVWENR